MALKDFRFQISDFRLFIFVPLCLCGLIFSVFAQSGRNKDKQEPEKTTKQTSQIILTQATPIPTPTPKITPTPTPVKSEDDSDVIRVESTLVPIPVTVTDEQGRVVLNLKSEDFELRVDGKPVEIGEIFRSETSLKLVMLFDNSSSVREAREFEKKAAIRFFKQVIRPQKDQVALFSVATAVKIEQPFTKNVSNLIQAIENFAEPAGATALLDAIIDASNYLKDVEGRRVIVIVSDGEDTISDANFEDAMKVAISNNCQVYIVKTTDFENYKKTGERIPNSNVRFLNAERRMQETSKQTGGAVYSPIDEKELDAAFVKISNELSNQYILGYYPEEMGIKGQFKEISVSVKNRLNLTVRTRKGYYVPKNVNR
ncbi:MAG: VWA domain-containing protein [Pyrinomonadaceae bacterium]|nr:VWA domain-containing protein [Pyrinomonadaceae bacterium]